MSITSVDPEIVKKLIDIRIEPSTPERRMEEGFLLRLIRKAEPKRKPSKTSEIPSRLFRSVIFSANGCWIWVGAIDSGGYGSLPTKYGSKAHRASYGYFVGDIPSGYDVMHKCDTRCCVNPDHLAAVTTKENIRDMINKGRERHTPLFGEKNPMSKLTREKVEEIRSLKANGVAQSELSKMFCVSPMTISRAVRKESWK